MRIRFSIHTAAQFRRFPYVINANKVFDTHNRSSARLSFTSSEVTSRVVLSASRFLPAARKLFRPAIINVLGQSFAAGHSSAGRFNFLASRSNLMVQQSTDVGVLHSPLQAGSSNSNGKIEIAKTAKSSVSLRHFWQSGRLINVDEVFGAYKPNRLVVPRRARILTGSITSRQIFDASTCAMARLRNFMAAHANRFDLKKGIRLTRVIYPETVFRPLRLTL